MKADTLVSMDVPVTGVTLDTGVEATPAAANPWGEETPSVTLTTSTGITLEGFDIVCHHLAL